jgi:2-keto-4-pentenoate hydratase/2-oxohepta-3-ene-1,7-dioic acid hydratase in catechol pathway
MDATPLVRGLTLLTLRRDGRDTLGVKTSGGVLDVARAAALLAMDAPSTLDDLLQREDGKRLQRLLDAALGSDRARGAFVDETRIEYGPLVSRPEKIVCVGLNYRKHAEETNMAIPRWPVLFNKFNGSLNRHGGTIALPTDVATQFDYEVELVIVMGRRASRVSEDDALSYVAGYATGNDFTARDLQMGRGQWMIGKALDGFAPIGPYLVTADQVDPDRLPIECRVNGETRQSSNTADFIFNAAHVVSYISHYFALAPGDLIFTGTPEGVILGKPPDERVWLKAGDRIDCSVGGLGELSFTLA